MVNKLPLDLSFRPFAFLPALPDLPPRTIISPPATCCNPKCDNVLRRQVYGVRGCRPHLPGMGYLVRSEVRVIYIPGSRVSVSSGTTVKSVRDRVGGNVNSSHYFVRVHPQGVKERTVRLDFTARLRSRKLRPTLRRLSFSLRRASCYYFLCTASTVSFSRFSTTNHQPSTKAYLPWSRASAAVFFASPRVGCRELMGHRTFDGTPMSCFALLCSHLPHVANLTRRSAKRFHIVP